MIRENINNYIATAMKDGDEIALNVYRNVKSSFTEFRTSKNFKGIFGDVEEFNIIKKLIKQRKESASLYKDANRNDLYNKEMAELSILNSLLPIEAQDVNEDDLSKTIIKYLHYYSLTSPVNMSCMGKCIKSVKEEYPYADSKIISNLVKEHINNFKK